MAYLRTCFAFGGLKYLSYRAYKLSYSNEPMLNYTTYYQVVLLTSVKSHGLEEIY